MIKNQIMGANDHFLIHSLTEISKHGGKEAALNVAVCSVLSKMEKEWVLACPLLHIVGHVLTFLVSVTPVVILVLL